MLSLCLPDGSHRSNRSSHALSHRGGSPNGVPVSGISGRGRRGTGLCDGLTRREFMRIGGLSVGGAAGGWWLGPARAGAPTGGNLSSHDAPQTLPRAKRCIVLFLLGGPPQHSTWDPKPQAPAEIRGELGAIATTVPGVHICELLPRTAQLMHHVALLRGVSTGDHAHSSSGYAMMTGHAHQPLNFENANPGAPNDWPTLAAVVQHLQRGPQLLPPAMRIPHHIYNTDRSVWPGQDAGFLGSQSDPWLFRCEPASPNFQIPEFQLVDDVTASRLGDRRQLLRQLDGQLQRLDQTEQISEFAQQQRQALTLLSSSSTTDAFDLSRESDAVRDRYGRGQFGQSVLLARRLVESGVSIVQVNWFRGADEPADNPCWDSHTDETQRLKNVLLPPLDMAYSALLTDLHERGLLDETLVVCMGEFGRTPKFNPRAGRDHWGHVFSVALAGGGVQGGAVHGASDNQGAYVHQGLVRPQDLTATIFHCLGFSPRTEIHDRLGRPFPISPGEVVREILV